MEEKTHIKRAVSDASLKIAEDGLGSSSTCGLYNGVSVSLQLNLSKKDKEHRWSCHC